MKEKEKKKPVDSHAPVSATCMPWKINFRRRKRLGGLSLALAKKYYVSIERCRLDFTRWLPKLSLCVSTYDIFALSTVRSIILHDRVILKPTCDFRI